MEVSICQIWKLLVYSLFLLLGAVCRHGVSSLLEEEMAHNLGKVEHSKALPCGLILWLFATVI